MTVHKICEVHQTLAASALAHNQSRKIVIVVDGVAPKPPVNVTLVERGGFPVTSPAKGETYRQRDEWQQAGRTYVVRQDDGKPGSYVIEGGGGEMMAGLMVQVEAH